MTIWHSSDFGWTAGQDISKQFAALAKGTFKPGDTFILDHMYKIGGGKVQLPDNFTLAAVKGGGFDVQDTATNSSARISLGNGNKLDNLTVTHSKTPNTGYDGNDPKAGVDYHYGATFEVFGKHDVTIESSKFAGNVAMFFDVMASDNLTVRNSHFDGAAYQMRWGGMCTDFRVENSLFQNALIDGIKTIDGGSAGTQRATIVNSVFEYGRDGIDMAGGFKDSVISKSIFRNNSVTGLDIKKGIDSAAELSTNYAVTNIKISDSQFIDNQNGIVVTMLDKAGLLTAANADTQMPHDIQVTNSIFEKTAGSGIGKGAFLIKDGHHITWSNIKILGGLDEVRILNAEAPEGWSAHDIGGTDVRIGAPRAAWTGYPFIAGPVDGGESAAPPSGETGPAEPGPAPVQEPVEEIAINAGGPATGGFAADVHYTGGSVYGTGAPIAGTTEDAVYQSERYGDFGYAVAVEDGTYTVVLKFAEIFQGAAGQRLFDVRAENQLVLDDFDIFAAAGGKNIALDRTLAIAVTDGTLNLDFISVKDKAKVSGIEIHRVEAPAPEPEPEPEPGPEPEPEPQPEPEPIKINAGGKASGDFSADVHFAGGKVYATGAAIAGTTEDAVYQTERNGDFGYAVDVANGTYEVTLKFAEIFWNAAAERLFDVKAENQLILDDFDVFRAAGGKNIALDRTFEIAVTDGKLNLDFIGVKGNAKIGGIVIDRVEGPAPEPTPEPAPEPVKINAGGKASGDFSADVHFAGGMVYGTGAAIANTTDDAVYQTERYGNFGYAVDVANGTYEVTLKFAEIHWAAAGQRLFDVKAENQIVLDDFDIFKVAGGKNVAVDRTITVNVSDGELNLDFVTVKNNAKISGIEIVRAEAPKAMAMLAPAAMPELSSPYDLVFSTSADRAQATDLDGGVLAGEVFVFTRGTEDAREVAFYLDDGKTAHVERLGFRDFVGTEDVTGDALPWDTAALADGEHSITAKVVTADGSMVTISDSFIIDNF